MHKTNSWKASSAATLLLLGAASVLAQSPGGAAPQSLLSIIRQGIEVPSYFIVLGSVVVLALIVEHFVSVRLTRIAPPEQVRRARQQIEARDFRGCLDGLRRSETFFARVLTAGLQHARHGFEAMHEVALEQADEQRGELFRKAEYLNIIGNLGPLLGLLGTVWGMIEAFGSLGAGGGAAGAGELAGGISKALVNTLLGLALAIVGIGFFGACRNRIDSLTRTAVGQALDLLEYFRPAATAPQPAPASTREAEPRSLKATSRPPATPAPTNTKGAGS